MMNRAEQKLVLELCRCHNPNTKQIENLKKQGVDEAVVLGQLLFHRVAGTAYTTLSNTGLLSMFHREFRTTLKAMHQSACEQTTSFRKTVEEIAAVMNETQVPYALLKGGRLCYSYPLGCRTSNDVDILLSPKDLDTVSQALYAHGFVQGHIRNHTLIPASRAELIQSRMTRGETVPFVKEVSLPYMQFAEIDLNFSLHEKNEQNQTVSELLSRRVHFKANDTHAFTLNKYDFILHLCAHLYKEASVMAWVRMNRDLAMYKYLDLYWLIQDWSDDDYNQLLIVAHEADLEWDLYYALYGTRELFGMTSAPLDQMLEYLELCYPGIEQILHQVFDPSNGRVYRYTNTDLTRRLFMAQRISGLVPDNSMKGSD